VRCSLKKKKNKDKNKKNPKTKNHQLPLEHRGRLCEVLRQRESVAVYKPGGGPPLETKLALSASSTVRNELP
jgi:hypothetical protein